MKILLLKNGDLYSRLWRIFLETPLSNRPSSHRGTRKLKNYEFTRKRWENGEKTGRKRWENGEKTGRKDSCKGLLLARFKRATKSIVSAMKSTEHSPLLFPAFVLRWLTRGGCLYSKWWTLYSKWCILHLQWWTLYLKWWILYYKWWIPPEVSAAVGARCVVMQLCTVCNAILYCFYAVLCCM